MARTTTARDGSYELRALLSPAIGKLSGPDGLDIEINLFHNGRHHVQLWQVRPDFLRGSWGPALVAEAVTPALSARSGRPGLVDILLDPTQGDFVRSEQASADLPAVKVPVVSWPPPTAEGEPAYSKWERPAGSGCLTYRVIGKPKRAMTTVATGVVRNGARMAVTYSEGAETTLSTGFSAGGGTFRVSGARTRSSSFTAEYERADAPRGRTLAMEYRMQYLHQTARRVCRGDSFDDYRVHYMTNPVRGTRGGKDTPSRYPVWDCTPGDDNTVQADFRSMRTQTVRAATYESAFALAPLAGSLLLGNAQSGYSKEVEIKFTFDHPEDGWWCGHTGDPGDVGQRLQAFEARLR
ncbi:MAG: hypothetical protein ACT4PP_12050 [Sporichthyaceae bacterium]